MEDSGHSSKTLESIRKKIGSYATEIEKECPSIKSRRDDIIISCIENYESI